MTATTLVGAGATLQSRTAVVFGVPSALVLLPLAGVSVAFVVLPALPLVLVGVGVAARQVGASLQE